MKLESLNKTLASLTYVSYTARLDDVGMVELVDSHMGMVQRSFKTVAGAKAWAKRQDEREQCYQVDSRAFVSRQF